MARSLSGPTQSPHNIEGAKSRYEASLVTLEGYGDGIAGLGRVAAARGDDAIATALLQQALAIAPPTHRSTRHSPWRHRRGLAILRSLRGVRNR
jgi:hypothetical protein